MKQVGIDQVLTLDEGAMRAGISTFRFRRAVKRGEVSTTRIPGGRVGVLVDSVDAFKQRLEQNS